MAALLASLKPDEIETFLSDWALFARDDQWPPEGLWTTWLVMGGRGSGKTRAGAEWVRGQALGVPGLAERPARRIALIGETARDVREVMVEGVSGVLSVHLNRERPVWEPSRGRLLWPNGAVAQTFSAEDPDSLRGPQFDAAWLDELAKWRHAQAAFDMLQFGLRLGVMPRQMITTTPRPVPLVKKLMIDPLCVTTHASTALNAANLAPAFLAKIVARYRGTQLGRQELDGEMLEEREDGLWTRALIEDGRLDAAPPLARIVVAVDPAVTSGPRSDACGIIAAGRAEDGTLVVLADATIKGAAPHVWAARALELWHRLAADALVAETNQGGDLVAAVMREIDPAVPVTNVSARRGKYLRAEPVALLYQQGRVRHAGVFAALEDEMCDFGPGGLSSGRSPDRLDALVWALTHLMQGPKQPRMRRV
jgi:phage terminase large subunit-like protein